MRCHSLRYGYTNHPFGSECPIILHNNYLLSPLSAFWFSIELIASPVPNGSGTSGTLSQIGSMLMNFEIPFLRTLKTTRSKWAIVSIILITIQERTQSMEYQIGCVTHFAVIQIVFHVPQTFAISNLNSLFALRTFSRIPLTVKARMRKRKDDRNRQTDCILN